MENTPKPIQPARQPISAFYIVVGVLLALIVLFAILSSLPRPQPAAQGQTAGLPNLLYTHCIGPDPGIPLWNEPGGKAITGRVATCSNVTPSEKRAPILGRAQAGLTWWLVRGETPAGERGQRGWISSDWVFLDENDPARNK